MSKRKLISLVLAGACALCLGGTTWAQAASSQPCRADAEKLCKGVAQGGDRIRECLRKHASELSAGCKAKMEAGEGIFAQGGSGQSRMLEACGEDQKKVCPKVEAGGGRIRKCLKEHLSELSPKCKEFIEQSAQGARRRGGGFRVACQDDLGKHCKGTEPGGGRLVECLKKHEGELSKACREAIADTGTGKKKK
jgi:hypothetical protein